MLVSTKGLSILKMFSYSFSIIRKRKRKRNTSTPYIKPKYSYQLLYCVSIIVPFRYLCYPNELFWTEEGFRSLGVMLMEKAGYATFKVKDAVTKKEITINNSHF
jgi:hypothetical protein